jgi:Gas vesicle synthesis protein GvpL/GvpF
MSYLVYCIVGAERREPHRGLRFLGYPRASIMVRAYELGAVASEMSSTDLAPEVARLLAYSKVVEWYNRDRTVIPMRYGCILDTLPDISRLLEDHQREYLQLLAQLDGHAEMSARVALSEPASLPDCRTDPPPLAQFAGCHDGRPGIAYLAERSGYYAHKDDFERRREEICRAICGFAEGTFVRYASEYGERGDKGVLALHFLVSRHGIGRLRKALRPLIERDGSSITLTGPWPPYNFVRSSTAQLTT